jgi:acetyltransferase-like isoleucine patch superfamily enzyme
MNSSKTNVIRNGFLKDQSANTNPFDTGYFSENELKTFGFKAVGKNVKIAKNCTISGLSNISLGDNVIIDAFCSIIATGEGQLQIGSFVHIGAFCHLLASAGIEMKDFSGLSQGVKIYSKSDDYSGKSMTNPTIPSKYKAVKSGKVIINEHVIIGANTIILPGLTIGEGASVGAVSLVSSNLDSWTVYFGNPLKRLTKRSQDLLFKKEAFLKELKQKEMELNRLKTLKKFNSDSISNPT